MYRLLHHPFSFQIQDEFFASSNARWIHLVAISPLPPPAPSLPLLNLHIEGESCSRTFVSAYCDKNHCGPSLPAVQISILIKSGSVQTACECFTLMACLHSAHCAFAAPLHDWRNAKHSKMLLFPSVNHLHFMILRNHKNLVEIFVL
jgi:hypothetical protein